MFEFHGWATIRDTAGCEDLDEDPRPTTVEAVMRLAAEADQSNRTVDVRRANGALHLWIAGFRNHRDDAVVTLFSEVAAAAPGSYGVLYVHDDESRHTPNAWRRLVMRRGAVHEEVDNSLSPHVGLVEDDCSGES